MAPRSTLRRAVSTLHAADLQRASHGVRSESTGLICTLFFACIGLANSVGSQHSIGQLRDVALRGGGPATCVPDLVADAATGLSLRDALLHTTAGIGQLLDDPGGKAAEMLAGEAGWARVEVRGRHCVGEIDPLYVSRSRNITLVRMPSEPRLQHCLSTLSLKKAGAFFKLKVAVQPFSFHGFCKFTVQDSSLPSG